MRIKPSYYFLGFLIVLMLYVVIMAASWERVESKVLPMFVGGIIIILSSVQLVKEVRAEKKAPLSSEAESQDRVTRRGTLRRFAVAAGWMLGFVLGIYLLGFLIAIPIFALAYLKMNGRGWLMSVVYAAVITAFIYGAFSLGLKLPFHKGLLFSF